MKVFTNTDFSGHWPVGTSAAVVAETRDDAAKMLEQMLQVVGLPQKISAESMQAIDTSKPSVTILQDGNY